MAKNIGLDSAHIERKKQTLLTLKNKVILITGSNRGQGKIIARYFASLDAKVVLGLRNLENTDSVIKELGIKNSFPVKLDITKEYDWIEAMKLIEKRFGKLDVLVNNAGIFLKKPLLATEVSDFEDLITVNQIGTFMGIKNAAKLMIKQKKGSIINNVSISSFAPINFSAAYAATKSAISTLSKSAAIDEYCGRFLPPLQLFLPLFAQKFTRDCGIVYQ